MDALNFQVFFACLMALASYEVAAQTEASIAASRGNQFGPSQLGKIQCNDDPRYRGIGDLAPTGCARPYEECDAIPSGKNAQTSCRMAAVRSYCPDFTWEKCCFITCNQQVRGQPTFGEKGSCMSDCMDALESGVYLPGILRK
jgi:hypothetical protein